MKNAVGVELIKAHSSIVADTTGLIKQETVATMLKNGEAFQIISASLLILRATITITTKEKQVVGVDIANV